MKKTKMSLCLTSGFVVAMSLAACSGSVTANNDAVVTITNYNGETVDILTDAIYDKYKNESNGVSKYYNAILEALIRYEYDDDASAVRRSNWTKKIKSNSEITEEAKNNVKNDKNTAQENADKNGTSYDTEWSSILSSHNVEDEDQLLKYYIYQLEKEDITDKYFLFKKDSTLTKEWIGIDDDGNATTSEVASAFPYHIRHILAKIENGANSFYDGTVSESEAKLLGNIMEALLMSDEVFTFADVARSYSQDNQGEDGGSAAKGGDLGIMTTTTGFVNEFKLGIYAFDAIYNSHPSVSDESAKVIRAGLGLNDDYEYKLKDAYGNIIPTNSYNAFKNIINDGEIQEVPYQAFTLMKEVSTTVTDEYSKQVNKGNEAYYPRNVLYNYYLNFRNPFVITNEKIDYNLDTGAGDGLPNGTYDANPKFIGGSDTTKGYLGDGNGNIIIGVRSEHGIHFMLLEKSIYDFKHPSDSVDGASLEEYYTSLVPEDDAFPHTSEKVLKSTYVNFLETSEKATYTTRASEIKEAVKGFDSTYDYRLFEEILALEGDKIKVKDNDLLENIKEYISRTRITNKDSATKTLNESWRTYVELIALQYDNRNTWTDVTQVSKNTNFKTIHPRCAIGFKKHTGEAWTTTASDMGVCYYEE